MVFLSPSWYLHLMRNFYFPDVKPSLTLYLEVKCPILGYLSISQALGFHTGLSLKEPFLPVSRLG